MMNIIMATMDQMIIITSMSIMVSNTKYTMRYMGNIIISGMKTNMVIVMNVAIAQGTTTINIIHLIITMKCTMILITIMTHIIIMEDTVITIMRMNTIIILIIITAIATTFVMTTKLKKIEKMEKT